MKLESELLHRIISTNHLAIIPNFFLGAFECDLFALNKNLHSTEYEIKCSKSDFNNDFNKQKKYFSYREIWSIEIKNKHEQIRLGKRTNRFYFVIEQGINVKIPDYAGLIQFERSKTGRIVFNYIRRAPLLHKNKASPEMINKCLEGLMWKYYRKIRKKA